MSLPSLSLGRAKKPIRRYEDSLPQWDNKRIVREILRLQTKLRKVEEKLRK